MLGKEVKQRGFTLVEMLVAIAVLAILFAVAVPSFQGTVRSSQLESLRDNLIASFQYAKTQAISSNQSISICPSSNGTSCRADWDWSEGWIVYEDTQTGTSTAVGTVLRVNEGRSDLDATHTGVIPSLSGGNFIRYVAQGYAQYATVAPAQNIGFCDPNNEVDGESLIFSATTGQVRPGSAAQAGC